MIAAHVLGLKSTVISTQQSFIKKLVSKFSLQVFLLLSVVLAGGIAGIAFFNNNSEESKKINITNSSAYKQTDKVADVKDMEEKNTLTRKNSEIYYKETSKQFSMENNSNTQLLTQNNISGNNLYRSERHTIGDLISTQIIDSISILNKLVIQKPEPSYFDYLKKERDSMSADSRTIENKNLKNNTPKKKKLKLRKRSTAKEKNKNKTERDRSGKNFKGI